MVKAAIKVVAERVNLFPKVPMCFPEVLDRKYSEFGALLPV
jgi:hypothetical protein